MLGTVSIDKKWLDSDVTLKIAYLKRCAPGGEALVGEGAGAGERDLHARAAGVGVGASLGSSARISRPRACSRSRTLPACPRRACSEKGDVVTLEETWKFDKQNKVVGRWAPPTRGVQGGGGGGPGRGAGRSMQVSRLLGQAAAG